MVAFLQGISPEGKIRLAAWLLRFVLIGWPATHTLMLVTDPPEQSWVFHVLLAISWLALGFTAVDVIFTTEVRKEVDDG
jgi:hypothetical protein